jgi:hypothetical protein
MCRCGRRRELRWLWASVSLSESEIRVSPRQNQGVP